MLTLPGQKITAIRFNFFAAVSAGQLDVGHHLALLIPRVRFNILEEGRKEIRLTLREVLSKQGQSAASDFQKADPG